MAGKPSNIFLWHVHGSWPTSFTQGPHRHCFLPSLPDAGPWGLGRCGWPRPRTAVKFPAHELFSADEAYGLDRFLSDWKPLVATVHRKGSR